MEIEASTINRAAELLERLKAAIGQAVVGQTDVIEQVVICLAASGHPTISARLLCSSRPMHGCEHPDRRAVWVPVSCGINLKLHETGVVACPWVVSRLRRARS